MSDLVQKAITAHGGWTHWQRLTRVVGKANFGGAIWGVKAKAGILDSVTLKADLRSQHVEFFPFGRGLHCVFEPNETGVVKDEGAVVSKRKDPGSAFQGHSIPTPWDDHHLIYFSGYAAWTYLTTPFLLILPGFQIEEINPWNENGETWRRLRVKFPEHIHTHSPLQTFYFNDAGILQRHDYSVDVVGGTSTANYAREPKVFDGIVIPTKRRAYSIGRDNRPLLERIAASIDFQDLSFT